MLIRFIALITFVIGACPALLQAGDFAFHHEHILGTSMELRVRAASKDSATQCEATALAEIERLNAIFSSYSASSEFSRFMKSPVDHEVALSNELFEVLELCDQWNHASRGVFNPATEVIANQWRTAAESGAIPSSPSLTSAVQQAQQSHWRLKHASRTAIRCSDVPLSLNAIAKGAILDRVATMLTKSQAVSGVMLNIGGDIRVAGDIEVEVAIADPRHDTLSGRPLRQVHLDGGGIATSGSSERFLSIGGVAYSHIIDPRDGMPVSDTISATVIAPEASTADALATICSVLPTAQSLALVNAIPNVRCLLVTATGVVAASANWPQAEPTEANGVDNQDAKNAESTGHEMLVEFEIAKSDASRGYRRPYVAVWIEDKDKFPVKTLSLFLMQNDPGPRWYRDMRRWYADDQLRKLVDEKDLIATISKPTRNPGKYKVAWDGRDDAGSLLKPGKYTLLIEAAREHGTYQLMKHDFELGGNSFQEALKPNVEIGAASINYSHKK